MSSPRLRMLRVSPLLAGGLSALALVMMVGGGCARPLLSPEDERSPYDRYDALRNQYAQQYVEDEYGRQKPNLRARLSPKE
ncbi:MAG: hypothetical protein ACT4PL_10455 [Phycisphaerales bacterium]